MFESNNFICSFLVIKCLFLIYPFAELVTHVGCFDLNFPTFDLYSSGNFSFAGSSTISEGALQLTQDLFPQSNANKAGRICYGRPFKLWNQKKNFTASFSTTFAIKIYNPLTEEVGSPSTEPSGEGMAFILTRDWRLPHRSEGQWLGIVNSTMNGSISQIVAVEFDTRKSYPEDLDDNHVGLDINSINSIKQISLSNHRVNLSGGNDVVFRIEYDGTRGTMDIYVGGSEFKLRKVAKMPLNMSDYLPESVYVGFSASTGNNSQLNTVQSWQFMIDEVQEYNSNNLLWIGVASPFMIISLCWFTRYLYWQRRLRKDRRRDVVRRIEENIGGLNMAPRMFRLKALMCATENFHPKNKLGKGGFGTVYRGFLKEVDLEVAIKRVSKDSRQGEQEFLAEVTTISRLRHKNLVKLLGWCHENDELLLVYEFMPKGSLDRLLFHEDSPCMEEIILNWDIRKKIIWGVANVMDYLHNGCEKRVLHRDLKSSNVMLDSEFNARLGDFGLARIIQHDGKTHHSTIGIAGTPGYMAPECYLRGRASAEMDVYGFGVFVLEVVCGRRPSNHNRCNNLDMNIVDWVWELYGGERIVDAVDPRLQGHFDVEQSDRLLKLGLACCHPNPNQRPTMRVALQVLVGEAAPPVLPNTKPAFVWPVVDGDPEYSLNGGQLSTSIFLSGR